MTISWTACFYSACGLPQFSVPLILRPLSHQCDDTRHRLGRGPQAVQRGAFRSAERLVARGAEESPVLARVDANIALACLASGGASQIGAACRCGVHDRPPGFVGEHAWRSMSGPPFSLQASFTTV